MPTKKQKRRIQKGRRHEYEYVYVDEEGNEVAVDPAELRTAKDGNKSEARARRADSGRTTTRKPAGRRTIEPPSWRRATRRGLIFAPLLIVAMMLLNHNVSLAQQIAPAIFLILFFIPFSYFTDSIAYRMYRKRVEQRDSAKSR